MKGVIEPLGPGEGGRALGDEEGQLVLGQGEDPGHHDDTLPAGGWAAWRVTEQEPAIFIKTNGNRVHREHC